MIFIAFFALVGCTGETSTTTLTTVASTTEAVTSQEQTTTQVTFEHSVSLILGDQSYALGFDDQTDQSLLALIEASDIHILYQTSEYGAMITEIGDYKADDFHWIGFTKNDEFAMSGVDSIDYADGDVFEFTENLSTWEMTLEATANMVSKDTISFTYNDYQVLVSTTDLSETVIVGQTYELVLTPISEDGNDISVSLSSITPLSYAGHIIIKLGQMMYPLTYDDTSLSVLDLIEASDIHILYQTSEYGAMITEIGDYKADDFHWIGFTKNDEFAMSGVDSIDYTDGDVFEFTENLTSWEISLTAELTEKHEDHLVFENQTQAFLVYLNDLPETIILDDLVVGFIYTMTGMVNELTDEDTNVFSPSSLSLDVIDDFTDLYDIQEGDVFILAFTVTAYEASSAFGYELFATDINGLSSTDISENMTVSSITDYLFYTIPDDYNLSIGQVYIGRFIYMVNEPSSIPQITLYEESITGATLSQIIVEE